MTIQLDVQSISKRVKFWGLLELTGQASLPYSTA